jgi:hypothetical protein
MLRAGIAERLHILDVERRAGKTAELCAELRGDELQRKGSRSFKETGMLHSLSCWQAIPASWHDVPLSPRKSAHFRLL